VTKAPLRIYPATGQLHEEALERILCATGYKFWPPALDRLSLGQDLMECADLSRLIPDLTSLDRKKNEVERLGKTKKRASQLRSLLSDESTWGSITSDWYRRGQDQGAIEPRQMLTDLIDVVERKTRSMRLTSPKEESVFFRAFFGPGSAFEQLVDKHLPKVFVDHFHVNATVSRGADGTLDTPYLRFAEQVLKEFVILNHGKPYTRESIASARSGKRTNRIRGGPTIAEVVADFGGRLLPAEVSELARKLHLVPSDKLAVDQVWQVKDASYDRFIGGKTG
jgi:hypothetical protein